MFEHISIEMILGAAVGVTIGYLVLLITYKRPKVFYTIMGALILFAVIMAVITRE